MSPVTILILMTGLLGIDLDAREVRIARSMSPVPPPPANPTNAVADDPRAAALGQVLFFDTGLSGTGAIACATCHVPELAFADGRIVSQGIGPGTRNTPTALGVGHHRWLFWDGRADTPWSQALHPLETDVEMGGSRVDIADHVVRTTDLATRYEAIFGPLPDLVDDTRFPPGARPGTEAWASMSSDDRAAVTQVLVNVGKAIEAYERRLQPGESDFDRWVADIRDDEHTRDSPPAMGAAAIRGFRLFIGDAGCRQCHVGPMFTDREFHDIGIPSRDGGLDDDPGRGAARALLERDPFGASGSWSDAPEGDRARRSAAARIGPEHWGAFRTPSLRNVALTAPYMHGGQFESLAEVIAFYDTLEPQARRHAHGEDVLRPLALTPAQRADLEAFLRALTGDPIPRALGGPQEGADPAQDRGTETPPPRE